MDFLLWSGLLMVFCEATVTGKLSETFEKFYTTDASLTSAKHHNAMGISTLAKFSMLSNTPTLFRVKRPGLNNDVNTVSLESMQKPGYYLRYKNYKFHMEQDDETQLFRKDATFRERLGPRGRAYELLGRDNWFMCHTDVTPFTLKARSERIGTQDFVNNCVYVPVKQDMVEKKNVVKSLPSGGAMVVNHVPDTQNTDKCISIRFVNHLDGPVRVVSSLKPEGYLVTANAFKLKTIFKHAKEKQRHVIFYAENVQDRDDDVMLNEQNVFTVKPHECLEDFKDVVLSSQSKELAAKSDAESPLTASSAKTTMNAPISPPLSEDILPTLPPIINKTAKPFDITQKFPDNLSTPLRAKTTPPLFNSLKPKPTNDDTLKSPPLDVPASELGKANLDRGKPSALFPNGSPQNVLNPVYHATASPRTTTAAPIQPTAAANEIGLEQNILKTNKVNTPVNTPMYHDMATERTSTAVPSRPTAVANEIGFAKPSWDKPAPLKQQIQTLNSALEKRIQTQPTLTSGRQFQEDNYEQWSSFGPCSVTCGVGTRRRSRVCRPGYYCYGPAAESRACIREQCASNCVHTEGGTVKSASCCHFPFLYNGAQYYHCILSPKNNERMWCATTPYYEQDKQWGYCPRSAKAPQRSLINSVLTTPPESQLPSYDSAVYYNNPYTSQDNTYVPCNAMCTRICEAWCPKHCCLSVRADLPVTAYMGNNYDKNDKRSKVFSYKTRYGQRLSRR